MKEQQKNRKSSKQAELKQMRFGLKIGSGDLEIKLRKIRSFLEAGHKVRIQIFYRGREMAHKELGYELIDKIVALLDECNSRAKTSDGWSQSEYSSRGKK